MMEGLEEGTIEARHRERVAFYRRYYDPIAANSFHGLAVIATLDCIVLYANTRFLANHGLPPQMSFPFRCAAVYGEDEPCAATGRTCIAVEAARERRELRRTEGRAGGDGLPERTSEILAFPLGGQDGPPGEVLVIEKEQIGVLAEGQVTDEEREHLATIARDSADAIIGLDRQGRIRSWNHGAEEIFGYTAEETIGREYRFLVPLDAHSQREFDHEQREFERKGILKNFPARRVAKDGRTVVVTCTSSLLRDAAGNPLGASVVCRDVTMEVLLKELIDHQIRAMSVTHEIGDILHSSRTVDQILQLILLGVTAGQGLGFNRAFLLLVEEDAAGGPAHLRGKMAIGPSNGDEAARIWSNLSNQRLTLQELYQRYLEENAVHDVQVNDIVAHIDVPLDRNEHVLVATLTSRRAVNVMQGRTIGEDQLVDPGLLAALQCDTFAVVPLNTRDRALGVLVVDNRITGIGISDADLQMLKVFANHAGIALENSQLRANLERRLEELGQLNLAMQESQARLMQAERLSVIGEMAARIVHEVRNPLVSIGGFARLVRRGFDPDDPRSDYLRIISDEVARLERIVQELLDFSRPQNRLELTELDPNALVREIIAMVTVEAEAHGVRVRQSYDRSLGQVRIDPDKTRQILLNVVRNALDVMLDEGELHVETKAIDGGRFRISVRDTGPGIPHERREEVFKPGFTTRQDGTGFGLAISKRLVELQGGQINLREAPPPGCTFDIVIPRRVEPRPEPKAVGGRA